LKPGNTVVEEKLHDIQLRLKEASHGASRLRRP
jgi:hypothetical protein